MTTDIGTSGAPYNTQIPLLAENADIQAALRIYHYGTNTDNPSPLVDNSIAGHLAALEANKLNKTPVSLSGSGTNLNNYNTNGWWAQGSNTNARSGSNYPTFKLSETDNSPLAYAGLLQTVVDNGVIYQTYHATLDVSPKKTAMAWRAYFAGSWSGWKQSSDDSHTHDNRYYQKSDTNTSAYSTQQVDALLVVLGNTKISSAQTDNVITLPADAQLVNGSQVPQGNPTAQNNDLWFY